MNEVEAVKAAIANTTDFDGDRMASRYADSELNAVALAAIAALDAARGDAEPDCAVDAWLAECTDGRVSDHTIKMLKTFSMWAHAHPPRGDQVARVVEWLRKRFPNRHNGIVQRIREDIAAEIERGEPFHG